MAPVDARAAAVHAGSVADPHCTGADACCARCATTEAGAATDGSAPGSVSSNAAYGSTVVATSAPCSDVASNANRTTVSVHPTTDRVIAECCATTTCGAAETYGATAKYGVATRCDTAASIGAVSGTGASFRSDAKPRSSAARDPGPAFEPGLVRGYLTRSEGATSWPAGPANGRNDPASCPASSSTECSTFGDTGTGGTSDTAPDYGSRTASSATATGTRSSAPDIDSPDESCDAAVRRHDRTIGSTAVHRERRKSVG
ncbi:hypothetical protein JG688_00015173 [Phytophthora aleatoria]|uniref:Uncharacterized protein n=1 Tax=Phytophthora aleatoria TaxID=2496075 RepID=A0A8J5IEP2_9STRA|nr:hypothetical protein JG688_00015173 [Phytophthora aleatoria]